MKYFYDLHIHSGLSPCADKEMSPANIIAAASIKGLQIIALSDHNSIKNVKITMEIGKMLDILVVPAIELQTNEDIHILCLFETYQDLENFYNSIQFSNLENKIEVFGNQYIYDEDDNIFEETRLLFGGADISESEITERTKRYNGIAVPAHIDRGYNGMLAILGDIPEGYTALEFYKSSPLSLVEKYSKTHHLIFDSDAHTLEDIGSAMHHIELPSLSIKSLIDYLRSNK